MLDMGQCNDAYSGIQVGASSLFGLVSELSLPSCLSGCACSYQYASALAACSAGLCAAS